MWLSGPPGAGKSTTGALMGKDAGYVYFEADCTMNGQNPFVPLDAENPTAAAFKQKLLKASKVLPLFEACFALISPSSLSMKIQIIGGKITENLGFKSPLWKVKIFLSFFLFIFKFFTQKWVSLIFNHFLISCLVN